MPKIFLSPSNQDANTYAWGNTTEDVVCGRIAAETETALKRCGFEVKTEQYDTMKNRSLHSDAWGADLHVPIHTNGFDGKVAGTRLMAYNLTGSGYKACQAIFKYLAPLTPGTSENISAHPELYEIKVPKATTAYIEVDFHDVPEVARWIVEHPVEIAEAITHGICEYFGVEYKAVAQSATSTPTATTEKKTIYRVQVGAFSVKANAEAYRQKLIKSGFADAYIVTAEK